MKTDEGGDSLKYHNGCKFTTKDKDNDSSKSNCAVLYKSAWWYYECYHSNLNGIYKNNVINTKSINWYKFHNSHMSLKTSEMKIKRKH
ncbi:hypothetical protein KUTeg_010961 [Tegillarca granosa]|uniref:Fibrinogen C-terminal domain-containing protein n=1 Tax=Tegillarca granosa TaxID=220873 RepID=A0ABQ9F5W5_TEGGR|nr:hypothetical protein KUTeg_010961 [Tegillarca granosa]